MESLANYGSDDENDAPSSANVNRVKESIQCGIEGDNYDDVQMEMSENPLNGSKAPSAQAHPLGRSGAAPPSCATIPVESGSESGSKDDDVHCSPPNSNHDSSSSSSPASAASSNEESDDDDNSKSEETGSQTNLKTSDDVEKIKSLNVSDKERDQTRRDLENRRDRDKEKEKDRDRDRVKERGGGRGRDRVDNYRRDDRHRSRSRDCRDRKDAHRSSERGDRRRSRDRQERRKSRERRSSSRERRYRESDRRRTETNRRDSDRKRHRSRSRSADRHRPEAGSRSSSSSGSSRSDARSKDPKVPPSSSNRGSRSRSKSKEKERARPTGGDSRKFYLEKKIDRKLNVLERMGIELKAEAKSSVGTVTPQMLVQRTMEQQAAQVRQATGVELPSYYNAAAVNPQRLVDQIQKRKLLWGARKDDPSKVAAQQPTQNKWQGATFSQDQDGKLTAKFNRLMGIKVSGAAPETAEKEGGGSEIIKKQEEMFHNMESQYEVARLATHTHRGLGLGFGTFQPR